jgi:hypothetical protein
MADKTFPNDIYDKISLYITNEKYVERLKAIPEHLARRDKQNIPQLIEKAELKNKELRSQLNSHIRFDDLLKDIKSGKIKMKRT